ncbi:unnamed protein product [Kuraishia capsulata CBS 1993]|uniref:Cns1/TTC4 wheel domain-containing protein n=1 Tax=Kuraishia capsulata CBS 1993 TaxID=1382522 RepID=W6MKQ1_9ASCO|nr:uncharacterized protein KUCA_T00002576001 [Kuraishia capsulata CBS 1993]CDK26603.1 unnamed protein product [Kuraishia capsulata CBS 1993]
MSEWERMRYLAEPGEPALPPQLSQYADKSTEEVLGELNRLPLFMNELDPANGDEGANTQLEALKALAYEGEPHEVAGNFKNQGNDCFKAKRYQDAIDYYKRALDVGCEDPVLNSSLHANTAACNLALKNYRRCINDCKECLKYDSKNIKALYRSAQAYFLIQHLDEAEAVLSYGLSLEPDNPSLVSLQEQITTKRVRQRELALKKEKELKEKQLVAETLQRALTLRGILMLNYAEPLEHMKETTIKLEDAHDVESQLIFSVLVLYPTTTEFDLVDQISELTTPKQIMEMVTNRDPEYYKDPQHQEFTTKKLEAYMETESGGVVKVGKNVDLSKVLMTPSPKIPMFDNYLKLYLVPKSAAPDWLQKWDKDVQLKRRIKK